VARTEKNGNTKNVLTGKPEGKRPLGRPRCGWEDDINLLKPSGNFTYDQV
jgi:hypothetical protein